MKKFSVMVFSIIGLMLSGGGELKSNSYVFHEKVTILPTGTDGTAGTNAVYSYFGDWPQTVKSLDVTVDETKTITIGFNTYYLGSDNCYYAKLEEHGYSPEYKYSDGTPVLRSWPYDEKIKYFKVEPIKWRVLTDNYNGVGRALLLAEDILDSRLVFYDGGGRKFCEYKSSSIRAYLNTKSYSDGCFLKSAFTENAQQKISFTNVENEDGTILTDKIFLLSLNDIKNNRYVFEQSNINSLIKYPTDYSLAKGIIKLFETEGSPWWLSTTECKAGKAWCILWNGKEGCNDSTIREYGIVPAITINLNGLK